MPMTRQEIIDQISPAISTAQGKTIEQVKRQLENCITSELGNLRDRQIASGTLIVAPVKQGLTEAEISSVEQSAKKLLESRQKLVQAQNDRTEQALQFQADQSARQALAKQEQDKQLGKGDRETFEKAARQLRFSLAEANFDMLRQVLGSGFSGLDIANAITNDKVRLVPASESEQAEFDAQNTREWNEYLLNADHETLRRLTRQAGQNIQNTDGYRTWQARKMKEILDPPPPLPHTNAMGEAIDAAYLRKISVTNVELFTKLVKKHGSHVTARLNGLD